jgi:hypothetical protein
MATDPELLAARLDQIRQRLSIGNYTDSAVLFGAVEAVLAFHQRSRLVLLGALCKDHAVCRDFSITSNEADRVRACPDCSATVSVSCTCGYPDLERCPHRLAIARELIGKGNSRA